MTREMLHWLMANRPNPRHLWEEEELFNSLWSTVEPHTLVDKVRCYNIYQCARQVASLSGDVAELGVYRGGTARLIAKTVETQSKRVHLFDTFAGMPPAEEDIDAHNPGDFADTSLESVRSYLCDANNVSFYVGTFPANTQGLESTTFSLVHLDCDLHASTLAGMTFFYPRMVAGGIIVVDDYATWNCHGCTLAVDEFLTDRPEKPIYSLGQAMIIKLSYSGSSPE